MCSINSNPHSKFKIKTEIAEMQESDNQSKCHSDEDSINFRPSPNFKHMKKYLKSKFEESSVANPDSSQGTSDSLLFGDKEQEKVNNNTCASAPVVNPPLPPNPPPPDSPPIVNVKKEIEDDEYTCENQTAFQRSAEMIRDKIKMDYSETSENSERIMCRNFARGTCKKGAACIFAHEMILSQLPGVYTFCRNFQNTVCTFPKCKFVHATVFEKEHFFRTGYLPPHTLNHLKEPPVLQPPPPPPPPEDAWTSTNISKLKLAQSVQPSSSSKPSPENPPVYSHAGTTAVQKSIVPKELLDYAGVPQVERNEPHTFEAEPSATTFSEREWNEDNDFVAQPGHNSCDTIPQQCGCCNSSELRLQVAQNMYEMALRRNQEIAKAYSKLVMRTNRLNKVLDVMYKTPNRMTAASRLSLAMERERAKERNLMTNLFAMMLRKNTEDVVPPDAS